MTVKDLIEKLQKVDPNLPVVIMDYADDDEEFETYKIDNGYGSFLEYSLCEVEACFKIETLETYMDEKGKVKKGETIALYF